MIEDPPDDEELAAQRTVMSYGRTALSFVGLAALVLREGLQDGPLAVALPVVVVALAVAALVQLRSGGYEPTGTGGVAPRGTIELAAAGATATAIGAALLVVLR